MSDVSEYELLLSQMRVLNERVATLTDENRTLNKKLKESEELRTKSAKRAAEQNHSLRKQIVDLQERIDDPQGYIEKLRKEKSDLMWKLYPESMGR